MKSLIFVISMLFAGAAYAVPADWVKVGKGMYTSPVCSTPECAAREAKDIEFYEGDLDGVDDDDE